MFGLRWIDADPARQVGCEQAVRLELPFDLQKIPVAGVDTVELLRCQDLVLGKVDLAATPDRGIDETVDSFPTGGLVAFFRVELEIEAVTILGKGNQTVIWLVRAQDGRYRRTG